MNKENGLKRERDVERDGHRTMKRRPNRGHVQSAVGQSEWPVPERNQGQLQRRGSLCTRLWSRAVLSSRGVLQAHVGRWRWECTSRALGRAGTGLQHGSPGVTAGGKWTHVPVVMQQLKHKQKQQRGKGKRIPWMRSAAECGYGWNGKQPFEKEGWNGKQVIPRSFDLRTWKAANFSHPCSIGSLIPCFSFTVRSD